MIETVFYDAENNILVIRKGFSLSWAYNQLIKQGYLPYVIYLGYL